jgi:hypothetical protein
MRQCQHFYARVIIPFAGFHHSKRRANERTELHSNSESQLLLSSSCLSFLPSRGVSSGCQYQRRWSVYTHLCSICYRCRTQTQAETRKKNISFVRTFFFGFLLGWKNTARKAKPLRPRQDEDERGKKAKEGDFNGKKSIIEERRKA